MCWGTFEAQNALNRLFMQLRVAKPSGDMREFLVLTPFDFVLRALVVIVVGGRGTVFEGLLVVDILSLGQESGWLSPSVIVLETLVIKRTVVDIVHDRSLRETCWHVALLIKVLRANLGDVQIDQESVVTVQLHQLLFVVRVDVDWVGHMHMLMWENMLGMSVGIAWRVEVVDLHVLLLLVLIDAEVEVFLRDNLVVLACCEFFGLKLVLELQLLALFLDDLVDAFLDFF